MTIEPNKLKKIKRRKKKRKLNIIRLLIVLAVVTGLVLIGSVSGFVMASMKDIPAFDPKALEPNLPSYIYDYKGDLVTKIFVEDREPIEFSDLPDVVVDAFLAAEDVRFYDHKGVDLRRIAGAALADIKAGEAAQGASTITQQLVKKAFLNPEKKFKRKIQEAVLAIKLEREYTKDQIFEMYVNRIYFGHGAYGIQSAAQTYFGKNVQDLTLEEAALLAGLPQAPSAYDPYKNPERAKQRRDLVLTMMSRNDFISEHEAEETKKTEIKLKNTKEDQKKAYPYPYFIDYVSDVLFDKYGEDQVFKGGLKVYTTLDPEIQKNVEKALANEKNFPKSKADENGLLQPQAAMVVIDPHTGHIKALAGGRDHAQKLQFNRAVDAKRQPGSSFKPIVAYAPAIEKGAGSGTVVVDEPTSFGKYKPENSDGKYRGPITYREAITHSVNVAAVKIVKETGITNSVKFAKKLGITSLVEEDENLAIALGGLHYGVSPLEMAGAYGAFANNGIHVETIAITKVEDRYGKVIDEFRPKKNVAMKETTAYIITEMLQSAVKSGTGTGARLSDRPVAGKTGTTNQGKDIWFAGYTPELVGVVWMGHDEPKPMPRSYGGTYPAKVWKEVMSNSLKGVESKGFERPGGLVQVAVCSLTGKRAADDCPKEEIRSEWFAKGTSPSEYCSGHVWVEVCAESGLLPTEFCPEKVSKSFMKRPEGNTSTSSLYAPTEQCNLHGADTKFFSICTDPAHGGKWYFANIPGPGQEGGCPDIATQRPQKNGVIPALEYCPIPEHQVRTSEPLNPTAPNTGNPIETGGPDAPHNPKKPTISEVTTQSLWRRLLH